MKKLLIGLVVATTCSLAFAGVSIGITVPGISLGYSNGYGFGMPVYPSYPVYQQPYVQYPPVVTYPQYVAPPVYVVPQYNWRDGYIRDWQHRSDHQRHYRYNGR